MSDSITPHTTQYYTILTQVCIDRREFSCLGSLAFLEDDETVLILKCFVDTDIDMELRGSGSAIGYRQMTQDSHRSRDLVSIRITLLETC